MPNPEGVTSMSWSFAGVACSKPCASRGEKLTSRLELSRITIRLLRRSYCAVSARGVDSRNAFPRRLANSNESLNSMYFLSSLAKQAQRCRQIRLDRRDIDTRKSLVLAQLWRPIRAEQIKYRLTASPDHMNVSGAVIVEINHHAQARKPEHCGHTYSLSYPKRLGYVLWWNGIAAEDWRRKWQPVGPGGLWPPPKDHTQDWLYVW
jgi:hypothetical protein